MLQRQLWALAGAGSVSLRRGPAAVGAASLDAAADKKHWSTCSHGHDGGHHHHHHHEPPAAEKQSDATVVLTNGDVESTALLAYWQHWSHGQRLLPLHVSFAAGAPAEQAALRVCQHLGLDLKVLNASAVADQLRQGQEHPHPAGRGRPPPHRHLLLLSLAASYAGVAGASHVALCSSRSVGAHGGPPQSFLELSEAVLESLSPPLWLLTPLAEQTRAQVIELGHKAQAPWHLSHSCDAGATPQCGHCPGCLARQAAFAAAGVAEAAETYAHRH